MMNQCLMQPFDCRGFGFWELLSHFIGED